MLQVDKMNTLIEDINNKNIFEIRMRFVYIMIMSLCVGVLIGVSI